MNKKEYISPSMSCVKIDNMLILAGSNSNSVPEITNRTDDEEDADMITVNVNSYGWQPDTSEKILTAHAFCKFMKGEAKEIGDAFNKTWFQAQELTQQNLICCVTSKRVVFIPQDNKRNTKIAIGLAGSIVGLDFLTKKVAKNIFTEGWLEVPLEVKRSQITSCTLSEVPCGNIVIINTSEGPIYLGCDELKNAMDINITIVQPGIFM